MVSKLLVIFDFDHTIVDGNTDTWITKLCDEVKHLQNNKDVCWTDRMAAVFHSLHEKKFTKSDFEKCLQSLPFTEGMKELLGYITCHDIECVIISDSNSFFIEYLLEFGNITQSVREVYTNPAKWSDSQLLNISHYHTHNCGQCAANMCKGDVLKSYIRDTDSFEKTILYIGDGRNDYCATLQMKPSDYVFPREGYTLMKLLQENVQNAQPKVIPWKNGFDILTTMKSIVEEQQ
ncbi:pyridoxal phosphate phosphatase PHOSPHO2-like [Dendronephthya gigantea]|uniref:pyridoxal phosphate phosphatase PHOSPHO2-like n=1 Tax=Dendronephthya gigantea TaxID=151771 RepID=UPI00106B59F8|nr:pyridoxal phosphate phosphatase PHOSPHO2-like [Dendronephthya gigantea]